jgi:hypothetical protein
MSGVFLDVILDLHHTGRKVFQRDLHTPMSVLLAQRHQWLHIHHGKAS